MDTVAIRYRRWIRACATGELIGIGVAAFAGYLTHTMFGEPASPATRLLTLAGFAAVGAVEGGALAALQWRVLREQLPSLRARDWVGITVAIAMGGWVLGMLPSLYGQTAASEPTGVEPGLGVILLLSAAIGAGAGLCFGTAQWVVLRRHAAHATRWIWIHVPAWALAMAAIFAGATIPTEAWSGPAIVLSGVAGGLLGGVLLGSVSGLVARDLRPRGC